MTAVYLCSPSTATAQGDARNAGCAGPPYTSCADAIPATYVSGSWIEDDGSSEWTITGAYAPFSGTGSISGSVLVFPPPNAYTCPVFTYRAWGYFYPASGAYGSASALTGFIWVADNPSPNITCSGYTPVSKMTFQNNPSATTGILNKGNDTGTGQWTNSSGLSGSLAIETNLILTPTSETLGPFTQFNANGWGSSPYYITQLQINQTLQDATSSDPPDPYGNKFQGRQVYETANGLATDGCYQAAKNLGATYPGGSYQINGSVWNVGWNGAGNPFGPDGVGWSKVGVDWYRANLPDSAFPCTAVIPQAMTIVNNMPGYSSQQYTTHTLSITLSRTLVTVAKDGFRQSLAYSSPINK